MTEEAGGLEDNKGRAVMNHNRTRRLAEEALERHRERSANNIARIVDSDLDSSLLELVPVLANALLDALEERHRGFDIAAGYHRQVVQRGARIEELEGALRLAYSGCSSEMVRDAKLSALGED